MFRFIFLLLVAFACSPGKAPDPNNPFKNQKVVTRLNHNILDEASGLESSLTNPGYFWSHNDSGGEPEIYLMDKKGEIAFTVELKGVRNLDWEEIVTATVDSVNYIFIADIGDNEAVRDDVFLLRIEEPKFTDQKKIQIPFEEIDIMKFRYYERARDAETLMYDSDQEQFILITKREQQVLLYAFPFDASGGIVTITSKGKIDHRNFTAGDISEAGEVLLKTYDDIYYFPAGEKSAKDRIFEWDPVRVTYDREPQGEAMCWMGTDFYTLSEKKGADQELLIFEKK